MHHHPCLCRLLDNLASFGFGDHPLADHHGRQTTASGDLPPNFSTPKHTASPDSSSCLQEGCQPQRCVLHEICIGCASLPPPSSFLLHVPFVSLASSGIVSPPAAVTLRSRHNTPPQRPPPPHGACDSSCVTWGQCGQLYSRSEMHDLKCERQQLPSSSWSLFHFWVGLKRGAQ